MFRMFFYCCCFSSWSWHYTRFSNLPDDPDPLLTPKVQRLTSELTRLENLVTIPLITFESSLQFADLFCCCNFSGVYYIVPFVCFFNQFSSWTKPIFNMDCSGLEPISFLSELNWKKKKRNRLDSVSINNVVDKINTFDFKNEIKWGACRGLSLL